MLPVILLVGQAGSGKDTLGSHLATKFDGTCIAQADPMKRFVSAVFGFDEDQLWGPSSERNKPDNRFVSNAWWRRCASKFNDETPMFIREVLDGDIVNFDTAETRLRWWFSDVERHLEKTGQLTPRYVLQTMGTEWGRTVYPSMWVDYAMRTAKNILSPLKGPNLTYKKTEGLLVGPTTNKPTNMVIVTDGRFRNEVLGVKMAGGAVLQIQRVTSGPTGGVEGHLSETEQLGIPPWFYDQIVMNHRTLHEFLVAGERAVTQLFNPMVHS